MYYYMIPIDFYNLVKASYQNNEIIRTFGVAYILNDLK